MAMCRTSGFELSGSRARSPPSTLQSKSYPGPSSPSPAPNLERRLFIRGEDLRSILDKSARLKVNNVKDTLRFFGQNQEVLKLMLRMLLGGILGLVGGMLLETLQSIIGTFNNSP